MNQLSKIELQVEAATAAALADPHRREAVSRLVDRLVRPGTNDPLLALMARSPIQASTSGQTPPDTDASPVTHKPTPANTSQHIRLLRVHHHPQAIHIPHAFELPGTEAIISQEGDRLIIEPIRKRGLAAFLDSLEPIDEDFPEIEDPAPEPEDIF